MGTQDNAQDLPASVGEEVFQDFTSPYGLNPTANWHGTGTSGFDPATGQGSNCGVTGFTTHAKDCDTGLTHMQARYYEPGLARFLSIDPVTFMSTGDPRMFNRYAYSYNDPINLIDPDGNRPQEPIKTPFSHKVKLAAQSFVDAVGHGLAGISPHASYNQPQRAIMNQSDVSAYAVGALAGGIAAAAGPGDEAAAGKGVASGGAQVFRVVGDAELADIASTSAFRIAGNAMESGKQFVDNMSDAKALQKQFSDFLAATKQLFKVIRLSPWWTEQVESHLLTYLMDKL